MPDERRHQPPAGARENSHTGSTDPLRNRLLNARDAIDYLGISLSTLNRIEKEGLLVPFRTPGGHRRYALRMLDEYLESTRQRPKRSRGPASDGNEA